MANFVFIKNVVHSGGPVALAPDGTVHVPFAIGAPIDAGTTICASLGLVNDAVDAQLGLPPLYTTTDCNPSTPGTSSNICLWLCPDIGGGIATVIIYELFFGSLKFIGL